MQTSPFLDEIRAESQTTGEVNGVRSVVLRLGRIKFRKPLTKKQEKQLESLTDLAQLQSLADRLLLVDSWTDLLARL